MTEDLRRVAEQLMAMADGPTPPMYKYANIRRLAADYIRSLDEGERLREAGDLMYEQLRLLEKGRGPRQRWTKARGAALSPQEPRRGGRVFRPDQIDQMLDIADARVEDERP